MENSKPSLAQAVAALGVLVLGIGAHADLKTMNIDSGSTKFLAVGKPSLMKIRGEGPGPKGSITIKDGVASGQMEVELGGFTTHIDMRDDHMKNKYLEVGKYPKAVLEVTEAKIPAMSELPKEVPFKGNLTLHGEKQPITDGTVMLTKDGDKIKFDAKFKTTITGHKIPVPSYAGIKVAESVDVEVESVASPATVKSASTK
jgi:polyisoprenoid-binding protein YceI